MPPTPAIGSATAAAASATWIGEDQKLARKPIQSASSASMMTSGSPRKEPGIGIDPRVGRKLMPPHET